MYPVLLDLGFFRFQSYGVAIFLGAVAALFFIKKQSDHIELTNENLVDMVLWIFIPGVIAGRLLWVIANLGSLDSSQVFSLYDGGFSFFGSLAAGIPCLYLYCKKKGLNHWELLDVSAPAISFALGVTRIGCFLTGCCHGNESTLPWAVKLDTSFVAESLKGVPIHPVQIYSSISLFIISVFLYMRLKKRVYLGQVIVWFLMLYSLSRFFMEFFRVDEPRGFLIENVLSFSQLISVVVLIFAFFLSSKRKALE
jgi:phosphatidylglycerol:prolipoprotein diacylglycerol transferase